MENILLPIFFIYFIWRFLKPEKNILRTPLFGLTNYLLEELSVKKEGDDSEVDDFWQDEGGEG